MKTILKIGETSNVPYKEYICDSIEDLVTIQNPVPGSIAYVYENQKVIKYLFISDVWAQQNSTSSSSSIAPIGNVINRNNLSADVQASLRLADTALQQHQDISGKQDVLVDGTSIKTINNTSILGEGNINIDTISTYELSESDLGDSATLAEIYNNKPDLLKVTTGNNTVQNYYRLEDTTYGCFIGESIMIAKFSFNNNTYQLGIDTYDLSDLDNIPEISGENDGSNWTSLTINGTKKSLPSGSNSSGSSTPQLRKLFDTRTIDLSSDIDRNAGSGELRFEVNADFTLSPGKYYLKTETPSSFSEGRNTIGTAVFNIYENNYGDTSSAFIDNQDSNLKYWNEYCGNGAVACNKFFVLTEIKVYKTTQTETQSNGDTLYKYYIFIEGQFNFDNGDKVEIYYEPISINTTTIYSNSTPSENT